jgi:putative membrane protein
MKRVLLLLASLFVPALGAVIGAVVTAAPAGAAQVAAPVSAQDRQWMQTSAAGDIFEIRGGQMAEQKGQSQAVRALGARLVADHTKTLSDARDLASKLGITLPSQPGAKMQTELSQFAAASGAAFDVLYAKTEISDHEQDISETTTEINNGSNSEVKQEAQTDLPILRTHLALAQQALAVVTGHTPSGVSAGSGGAAGEVPLLPVGILALLAAAGSAIAAFSISRLRRRA